MMRQAISPRLAIRILRNMPPKPLFRIAGEGAEARSAEAGEGMGPAICPHPPIASRRVPPSPAVRETGLKRDVVVLFPRVLQLLVAQHRERAGEAPARRRRLDHVVDKAAA